MMRRLEQQLRAALRQHLAGGRARPPEAGVLIWNAFDQMSRARSWHAHGPNPISFAEIAAWCSLMRMPLEPAHIGMLRGMDSEWLSHTMAGVTGKGSAVSQVSSQPMTADIFDALMG